jgi:hypothetical protein
VTLKIPRSWSDRFTLLRQLYDDRASHAAMASATRIPIDQIPQALNALLKPDCLSLDAPLAAGLTDCWELPDSRPPPEPDWEPEPVYEVSCWGLAQ